MSLTLRRTTVGVASLAIAATSLVGCSNSESDSTSTSTTTSTSAAEATTTTTESSSAAADKKDEKSGKKAIVMEYGAADTLASLGLEDHIAAISTVNGKLPKPLEGLQSKIGEDGIKDLGSLKKPKLDVIADLSPDVIYYGARGRKIKDEFSKLSDNVYYTQAEGKDGKTFFESNRENVEQVAKDFDAMDKAEPKLAEIDKLVDEVKAKSADAGTALILMTTGGKVSAYGADDGWYGFIYNDLGFKPAGDIVTSDVHGNTISWEQLAELNPDHVFVFDRDAAIGKEGESAEQILDNEIFKQTNAAKNGNVHYLEPQNWYLVGGGLDAMKSMVTEVKDALK